MQIADGVLSVSPWRDFEARMGERGSSVIL